MTVLAWGLSSCAERLVASAAAVEASSNVRTFFEAGRSDAIEFAGMKSGHGLGLGLEAERIPWASLLFRVDWHHLTPDREDAWRGLANVGSSHIARTLLSWTMGGRLYPVPRASLRPYAEVTLGVRIAGRDVVRIRDSLPGLIPVPDGQIAVTRVGLSWASTRSSGPFVELGREWRLRDLDRDGLLLIRAGVLFP